MSRNATADARRELCHGEHGNRRGRSDAATSPSAGARRSPLSRLCRAGADAGQNVRRHASKRVQQQSRRGCWRRSRSAGNRTAMSEAAAGAAMRTRCRKRARHPTSRPATPARSTSRLSTMAPADERHRRRIRHRASQTVVASRGADRRAGRWRWPGSRAPVIGTRGAIDRGSAPDRPRRSMR